MRYRVRHRSKELESTQKWNTFGYDGLTHYMLRSYRLQIPVIRIPVSPAKLEFGSWGFPSFHQRLSREFRFDLCLKFPASMSVGCLSHYHSMELKSEHWRTRDLCHATGQPSVCEAPHTLHRWEKTYCWNAAHTRTTNLTCDPVVGARDKIVVFGNLPQITNSPALPAHRGQLEI